jgi:hypothetical protein
MTQMYDAGKIIIGVIIFVALIAFPIWYNAAKGGPVPKLQLPKEQKFCVETKDYMRAAHMDVLDAWRDSVVRDGNRIYVAFNDKKYNMSLQNTCMDCHKDKTQFCDKCHDYLGVSPKCWECHIAPEPPKTSDQVAQRSQ